MHVSSKVRIRGHEGHLLSLIGYIRGRTIQGVPTIFYDVEIEIKAGAAAIRIENIHMSEIEFLPKEEAT